MTSDSEQHIIREMPRFTYEECIAEACTLMVSTRTVLKVKIKKGKYNQFGQELRDFYSAFVQFYGLVFQRLSERGGALKADMAKWDKAITVLPISNSSRRTTTLIEEGIRLSEDLQEVLKADGTFV